MIMNSYIEEGYIHIPIYYMVDKKKIIINTESMLEDFNEKVSIIEENPKKYVEE
jgi:hypothetical protein